jgi:DNA-binding MarR family transcriptional regulator
MEFLLKDLPTIQTLNEHAEKFGKIDTSSVITCLNFLQTSKIVADVFDIHFSRYGLTEGKFTVLMLLLRNSQQGLTPSELAEKALVTRSTITGLIDGLEKMELVKRGKHPDDRRKMSVFLTDIGEKKLEKMLPNHYKRTANLMSSFSEGEKETFLKLLEKIQTGTKFLSDENF